MLHDTYTEGSLVTCVTAVKNGLRYTAETRYNLKCRRSSLCVGVCHLSFSFFFQR